MLRVYFVACVRVNDKRLLQGITMNIKRVTLVTHVALPVQLLRAPTAQRRRRATAPKVTSPMQEFGHNIGDDYFLVNYQQLMAYWKKLDSESPRVKPPGDRQDVQGRPMLMAVVTSPANHQQLARYKEISTRLARAEGLTDAQARALAKEGKSVVWIDGGLHANETLGAQQLVEHVYRMASLNDEETHAHPERRDSARRARQPGRHGSGVRLVHEARQHEHPGHVQQVRRPR